MTFDDGILEIYKTSNAATAGSKPVTALELKDKYYFGYDELGVTRYYQAMQVNQKIDCVVSVPGWNDIKVEDICILESGQQYTVKMVQPTTDENGLRIMRLTLEGVEHDYEVPGQS